MPVAKECIDECVAKILKAEGGWADRTADRGGPTNKGITIPVLSEYFGRAAAVDELKALSDDMADAIYRKNFVMLTGFYLIDSPDVFKLAIDIAVNHGRARAAQWLQEIAKVIIDSHFGPKSAAALNAVPAPAAYRLLLSRRTRFYGQIIAHDHTQTDNAGGWLNRVADFIEVTPCSN